jgi:hypothetical protein
VGLLRHKLFFFPGQRIVDLEFQAAYTPEQ